jgi:hypothetical protein
MHRPAEPESISDATSSSYVPRRLAPSDGEHDAAKGKSRRRVTPSLLHVQGISSSQPSISCNAPRKQQMVDADPEEFSCKLNISNNKLLAQASP